MLNVIYNNKHLNNLDKTKPVVLALSGGVDSMVLFHLLKNADFKVVIAHVNHHKRAESIIEEEYIRDLAKENCCPIEVLDYIHDKNNFQAEAHNSRYNFFYETAKKYNASSIITAHHYIDNLETIIMNIIRGSNIYGYAGIKEISYYNGIAVIRPLISVDKNELYNFAEINKIKYFEDSSNTSDDYLRNRIRHHVIPNLQKENPNLGNSITNYSTQLHEAFEYIRSKSVKYLEENGNKINLNSFNNLALIEKKDIINYICDRLDILSSDNKIKDILALIENPKPNLSYCLNTKYQFIKAYDVCYVKEKSHTENIHIQINKNETVDIIDYGTFTLSNTEYKNNIYLEVSNSEPLPLIIRKRLDGDKLIIGSGHKKLKDFLIDKKIPKEERDNLLIVTNSLNEIIWVMGYYKKRCEENNCLILEFKEKIYGRKI